MVNILGKSLKWFWSMTAVYGLLVILLVKTRVNSINTAVKENSTENVGRGWLTTMYFVLVLLSQGIVGISSTMSQCGGNAGVEVVWAVVQGMFYWIVVFGVIVGLLTSSSTGPSWRSPFSNGFVGWMFSSSINTSIKSLAEKATGQKVDKTPPWVDAVAARLSSSTYVTDVRNPGAFEGLGVKPPWKSTKGKIGALQKQLSNTSDREWETLVDILCQRDAVSNLIWFGLAGTLSALMYATTLSTAKCSLSSNELKQVFENAVKNQHEEEEAAANQKVYKVRD